MVHRTVAGSWQKRPLAFGQQFLDAVCQGARHALVLDLGAAHQCCSMTCTIILLISGPEIVVRYVFFNEQDHKK